MSEPDVISIRGACEHNLKSVSLDDPEEEAGGLHRRVAAPGRARWPSTPSTPRGSAGTSSRLSAYARQFLGQMEKPEVRHAPRALAHHLHRAEGGEQQPPLDRRHGHRGPRLPARALRLHRRAALPEVRPTGRQADAPSRSSTRSSPMPDGHASCMLLAPLVQNRKGEHRELLADAQKRGFARARVDGGCGRSRSGSPSTRSRSTTSSSWSTGWCSSPTSSAGSPTRWRPRCARARACSS